MTDEAFKKKLIKALKVENISQEEQDVILAKIEVVAQGRLANALPDLLDEKQLTHLNKLGEEGKDDEFADYIEANIPKLKEMMQAMMLDIADELDIKEA
jgi:hypothetical protein